MKVSDIMCDFLMTNADTPISRVAKEMEKHSTGSILVKDGDILGILTERDILKKVVAADKDPGILVARDIMSSPIKLIPHDTPVAEASSLMDKHRIRRLAVTDKEGKIIGKVTANLISRRFKYLLGRDSSKYTKTEFRY